MIVDARTPNEMERCVDRLEARLEEAQLVIDEIRQSARGYKERTSCAIVSRFVLDLYNFDYESIRRDAVKIAVLDGTCAATETERFQLLRILFKDFLRYCDDDLSFLLNECERMLVASRALEEEDLPFV